jgi:tetratricopeptide (TPR) repeat protein
MAEPARADLRYTAFLSYSHRDAAAAGRLHRRLESYRVPKRLVGTETPRGLVPQRLWPIFRDREELPAASDLSETVRTALAQSGALIILCSANAAGSLWVAEEIETFRKLHPDRPILAAILDGDPPDCFPAALRAFGQDGTWHEPLATDLRPKADGKHLGLLKLVAGITGLGLDDLVQRDASRRVRRITTLGTLALIGTLIMAALAVIAFEARQEAERQRAEAEDLVQFMLTNLHSRLKDVGRLDVMRAVNERAIAHYDMQISRGDGSVRTALQRVRVLQGLGEQDVLRADLTSAIDRFVQAYRITGDALSQAPGDPDRIFADGQSDYWIGRVHELRQEWPAARHFYQAYARAAERLIAGSPANPDYMMERAYAATNLGVVSLRGASDPVQAEQQFRLAVRWFEAASRARPGDETARIELANALGYLGDSYWLRRLWPQALAARQRQVEILEPLYRADPSRSNIFYRFALGQNGLARARAVLRDYRGSVTLLAEVLASARRLTARDPDNGEWRMLLAFVDCELLMGPFLPAGMNRVQLAGEFRDGMTWMRARGAPGLSQFERCERAVS